MEKKMRNAATVDCLFSRDTMMVPTEAFSEKRRHCAAQAAAKNSEP
jgi:hypothetical protein